MEIRQARKIVGPSEIPVPDGHARRHKGMTHVFAKAEDAEKVLAAVLYFVGGAPDGRACGVSRKGDTVRAAKGEHRVFVTLPHEGHPFATISF